MAEIDPVEFGAMRADVQQLKLDVTEMRGDVKNLLEMANTAKGASKGAVWFGRALAGAIGGIAGAVAAVKVFIR